ncbi:MAG: glycosyltransferase family 9 protein [Candidatus Zixiibacteriota bacterium]
MKSERINYEDLRIAKEICPFLKIRLKRMKRLFLSKKIPNKGRILIVDTCPIGDFLSHLPALRTYTKKNDITFDILVSPTVKPLAEKTKGVNRVFVAKSSYHRDTEQNTPAQQSMPQEYDLVIVLRLSREAYDLTKNIRCEKIITSDIVFLKYIFHLAKNSLLKKEMKQSRETIFETLRIKAVNKDNELYDLFNFNNSDYDFLENIPEIKGTDKKVLIHTGSGWKVKLWKTDNWTELLRMINALDKFTFIFIGGTEEEKRDFDYIQKNLNFKVYSIINKVNLRELFLVMKISDYFIGVDSGPRNLAHFADLRSVSLLSPAAVKNFMPFSEKDMVVEKPNRLPANLFNFNKRSNMERISAKEVFEAFKKLSKTN